MPVQFSCGACKKKFKAADKFAGKNIPCPNCKTLLKVPSLPPEVKSTPIVSIPTNSKSFSQSELDAETLAASALDESNQQENVAPEFIEFVCSYCDEKNSVALDLGGKQTPCTSCRRILKVPMPVKKEGPDWKKQSDKRPLGALRIEEPELEGTWNSTLDSVSRDALLEAGAIVEEFEPLTRAEKIKRFALVLFLIFVGLTGYLYWNSYKVKSNEEARIAIIETKLKTGDLVNLSGEVKSVLLTGIAVSRILDNADTSAPKIKKNLQNALASLEKTSSLIDKDFALLELCRGIIALGGNKDEIRDGKKLKWDEVQKFLKQPFDAFSIPEFKLLALKEATFTFVAKDEVDRAIAFASQVLSGTVISKDKKTDDQADSLAIVGLVLFNAKKSEPLKQIMTSIVSRYTSSPNTLVSPFTAALFKLVDSSKPLPFVLSDSPANEAELYCKFCVDLTQDKFSDEFKRFEDVLRLNIIARVALLSFVLEKDGTILSSELNRIVSEGVVPNLECIQCYLLLVAINSNLKIKSDSWDNAAKIINEKLKSYKDFKQLKSLITFAAIESNLEYNADILDKISKIDFGTVGKLLAFRFVGMNSKNAGWFIPALGKLSDPDKSFGNVGIALSNENLSKKK